MNEREKLIEEARRAKTAVYLATDASVADDLSRIFFLSAVSLTFSKLPQQKLIDKLPYTPVH